MQVKDSRETEEGVKLYHLQVEYLADIVGNGVVGDFRWQQFSDICVCLVITILVHGMCLEEDCHSQLGHI